MKGQGDSLSSGDAGVSVEVSIRKTSAMADGAVFIVRTRFSVVSGKWPGFVPDKSWLDFRIDLLKKCGLRAMERQTYRKYVWFLEASPETIDYVSDELGSLSHVNGFVVVSTGGRTGEGFAPLSEDTRKLIPDSDYYVITRVDSDDVLHPRSLECFSRHVSPEVPLVGIERGYKFDWINGDMYVHDFNHSAFFCLLSRNKEGVVGPGGHKIIRKHYNHTNLINIPFVQIVHQTNVRAGIVEGDKKLSKSKRDRVLRDYGIKWEPTVQPPRGKSNPQVALREYLSRGRGTTVVNRSMGRIIDMFRRRGATPKF